MNKTLKRREQRKRQKMRNLTATEVGTVIYGNNIFGCKPVAQPCCTEKATVKKENPMYVDYISNDKHIASSKINYFQQRAESTKYKILNLLQKQFGLIDDETPTSPKELVERITSGKYVLPTEKEVELMRNHSWAYVSGALLGIKWRDPSVKEDNDGFKVANAAMDVEFQKTQDIIMNGGDMLAAVQTFDAWTYTPAA